MKTTASLVAEVLPHLKQDVTSLEQALALVRGVVRKCRVRGEAIASDMKHKELMSRILSARAGIELGPAAPAIETMLELLKRDGSPTAIDECRKIAVARVYAVAALLAPLEVEDPSETDVIQTRTDQNLSPVSGLDQPINPAIAENIALHHREHERYYAWQRMTDASDLCREANRLKAVATHWLDSAASSVVAADYSDPRAQAAGCVDLNPLLAIGSIGILFMEGEREPAEIRAIIAKLRGLGSAWHSTGRWLSCKMDAAWARESVLLGSAPPEIAGARLRMVTVNWRGAGLMRLSGLLLEVAAERLVELELRPQTIRTDLRGTGKRLLEIGWLIDAAAQNVAREAAELSENDVDWTRYIEWMRSENDE